MNSLDKNLWQTRAFARRANVSVRTLHHYDCLELLIPHGYTAKGFRLYGEREFARLQQILTLKYLGFSLVQIKEILAKDDFSLKESLQIQRGIIEKQINKLNFAIEAIDRAEELLDSKNETDWESFNKIIEVIDMEQNMGWTKKYYSEAAQAKIEERKKLWSPELQEKVTADWNALIKEVEAAMAAGEQPSGDVVQKLAARWRELVAGFTGGDPEIHQGLNKMYADESAWQGKIQKPFSNEVFEFICSAMKETPKK